MRSVFISYARDDRQRVEALAERLRRLVDTVWFDSQLHGGEDWWVGILDRIRACDIFVAVVSPASLNSEACRIEREYAAAVHRSILPVALDAVPSALPSDIATLQIVDFSEPGEQSVSDLARALLAVPEADPLPDPLPPEPDAPLSYLIDLVDLVGSRRELTKSEQMEILFRLEHGLESSDQDEREGARQVLLRMKARDDLAVSVGKAIDLLARENGPEAPAATGGEDTGEPDSTRPAATIPVAAAAGAAATGEAAAPPVAQPSPTASTEPPAATDQGRVDPKRRAITLAAAAAVVLALVGGIALLVTSTGGEDPAPRVAPTTEPTVPPSEEPTEVEPPAGDQCQPPLDFFPGVVEPETCNEAYGDNRVQEWSWLLVAAEIIGDDPSNCNGCYTGVLVDRVVAWQAAIGLPADGVLDGDDYDCIWHGACPGAVPEFFAQPSFEGDCDLRPDGTTCLLFDDGYLWLVEDSVIEWFMDSIDGQPLQVAVGTMGQYWHVLDTDLVAVLPTADDMA